MATDSKNDLQPGDQVLVSIPGEKQTPREIWGFLISVDHAKPGELWVVFDVLVSPAPEGDYKVNSVLRVHRDQIQQIVRKDKRNPLLHIRIAPEDNSILAIRRIDGNTEPLVIQVDQGPDQTTYRVDHKGSEELE